VIGAAARRRAAGEATQHEDEAGVEQRHDEDQHRQE
jgi:hypothetical protein